MKNRIKLFSLLTTFAVVFGVIAPLMSLVEAASLTDLTITPASQNQSTATNVTVTFTPNTAITNGTILEFTYDTAFTGGASLVNADIAISGTNITGKTCSGFTAGYFSCTLTTSASVTTTVTTVVGGANQLTTPASAGNYSWSVSANIGGTGSTYDVGAGLAYISNNAIKENQVQVTATVPPTIALNLDQAGSNTLLSDPNTCALGVLSLNAVKTCAYDVAIGTNNTAGATVKVLAGGSLTNGSYNFTGTGGSPAVAGTEGYGFWISTAGSAFTAAGSYSTRSQNVPTSTSTFASSAGVSSVSTIAQHFTVTHEAAMSTGTATGNYTQTLTYTAFTN